MFDNSDLPKNSEHHSDVNKKVLGKFKDEAKGVAIAEFVGLRPKLYAMRLDGTEFAERKDEDLKLETKKSKGTAKAVVKKQLRQLRNMPGDRQITKKYSIQPQVT